jgi:hypothetical protein
MMSKMVRPVAERGLHQNSDDWKSGPSRSPSRVCTKIPMIGKVVQAGLLNYSAASAAIA